MTAPEIIGRVPITSVVAALGGTVRHGRCRAFWRDGDGFNVSLNDERGAWFDHARGEGGGVLDVIQRALSCDRKAALQWLADRAGVSLDLGWRDGDPADYRRFVAERRYAEVEAEQMVAWRDRRLLELRALRGVYGGAYHRSLQHILHCERRAECCSLAMDAADLYELRADEIREQIDRFAKRPWPELLGEFRAARRRPS